MQFPDAVALTIIPDSTGKPEKRQIHDLRAIDISDNERTACEWFLENRDRNFSAMIEGTDQWVRLGNARILLKDLQERELEVTGGVIVQPEALAMFWA